MIYITESKIKFGPFSEDKCFYIEKTNLYKDIQENVKIAEFILLESEKIFIIEAKSSSPNPNNKVSDNEMNFKTYIEEISEKLNNSLSLWFAVYLKRHSNEVLPRGFQELNVANVGFRLFLIIKGHKKEWLPPIQEALQKSLNPTIKLWGLSANTVLVINDELAHKYQLITSE